MFVCVCLHENPKTCRIRSLKTKWQHRTQNSAIRIVRPPLHRGDRQRANASAPAAANFAAANFAASPVRPPNRLLSGLSTSQVTIPADKLVEILEGEDDSRIQVELLEALAQLPKAGRSRKGNCTQCAALHSRASCTAPTLL